MNQSSKSSLHILLEMCIEFLTHLISIVLFKGNKTNDTQNPKTSPKGFTMKKFNESAQTQQTAPNSVEVFETIKLFAYAGSKYKFKNIFHSMIEKMGVKKVGTYIEPFAGSLASMFHNLEMIKADKIVINDFNPKLINLYKQIKDDPKRVYLAYKMIEDKFQSLIPEDSPRVRIYEKSNRDEISKLPTMFKYIRSILNDGIYDYANAAWLFVMNHNFNGLYGENKKGDTNVSFNWSTKEINIEKIKRGIFNLSDFFNTHNVVFENLDVDTLIDNYNDSDTMVYLDPPYINTHIQYNKHRTGTKKKPSKNSFMDISTHLKMIDKCSKYKYVMYSNNHHEDFVKVFDGYVNFDRQGNISANSKKSKKEILSYKINDVVSNNIQYQPNDDNYSISTGTAFSGLGCPEYVLKRLGVNHTSEFVIDNNKFCRETLKINHNPKVILDDIKTVDGKLLPSCDLYVWGSPCQNFSMSATSAPKGRLGLKGDTGQLFWDGYRILKDTQPKYSIFENVKGLVNHDKGNTFKIIMRAFEELGSYNIYHKVINPIDIGGNTNRERIFIILIRKDIDIEFHFPKNVSHTRSIKDCLIESDNYKYLDKSEYIPWERSIEKQRGKLRKDFKWLKTKRHELSRIFNINYPCPTLQRACHVLIYDGKGVRLLSKEELKLIQGFGDDLDLSHLSDTQYKSQLGNTMEVMTMEKLIGEIVRIDKIHLKQLQFKIAS
jgi:DNA-cytosine methyltransferase